jgi:hypothetical protein
MADPHLDIAALVEHQVAGGVASFLRMLADDMDHWSKGDCAGCTTGVVEMVRKRAAECDQIAAALRSLTRPVEDEEVGKWILWLNRGRDDFRQTGYVEYGRALDGVASLLARLAREKASAEQEVARLRTELEKVVEIANREPRYQEALGRLGDAGRVAERALAAAAGTEEPGS